MSEADYMDDCQQVDRYDDQVRQRPHHVGQVPPFRQCSGSTIYDRRCRRAARAGHRTCETHSNQENTRG